jgi:hypothetical protein
VFEILAPDAEICILDDHVPHYFDGKGLDRVFRHHGNAPTLELGVVELTGADPVDVGHNKILEDEHVDDGVVVCHHHSNEPTFELGVVELPGTDPGDVGHNKLLEDEHVNDDVEVFD